MKPLRLGALLVFLAVVPGGAASASDESLPKPPPADTAKEAAALVDRVQRRYETTRGFRATFEQTVALGALGGGEGPEPATGEVWFRRPGRMRWEFEAPEPQTIISDGSTIWIHQPLDDQVLRAPLRSAFRSTVPVSFLLGVGRLDEEFAPSIAGRSDGVVRLRLEPKGEDALGTIVLGVDAETADVRVAEVTDPLGSTTTVEFGPLDREAELPDSLFEFEIPDGSDVIDAPPSMG